VACVKSKPNVKLKLKGTVMILLTRTVVASTLLALSAWAQALDVKPYSADALAAAEKAGQAVALHFHADWCPTCRAQEKSLAQLKTESGLDMTVLTANYDTEKDLKKRFNVRSQSTLVVLKGAKESSRVIGETSADALRKALKTAL
jgi:thioredoxin 1